MNWFARFFSIRGKASAILKGAIDQSKSDRAGAIQRYTEVIEMKNVPLDLKAMALFNRGLAYSQDQKTELSSHDFQAVLAIDSGAPQNVVSAAKERLERLRRRSERP